MNLQGKTALVTGGATGLGFSLTKQLLAKGMKVAICARTQTNLDQAKSQLNSDKLSTYVCDISDYAQAESMVKQISSIDVLINNAGIWLEGPIDKNDPKDIAKVISINLTGLIYVTKAVLPKLAEQNHGFIINISSTAGLRGREGFSVYAASKWGVTGFTDSLKADLKDTNIRVVGFYPGGISTSMYASAGFPKDLKYWMNPDKVAEVIVFILQRDDSMIMDHVVINRTKR